MCQTTTDNVYVLSALLFLQRMQPHITVAIAKKMTTRRPIINAAIPIHSGLESLSSVGTVGRDSLVPVVEGTVLGIAVYKAKIRV